MLLVLTLLAVGTSLTRPPLFGLLSNLTWRMSRGPPLALRKAPAAWRAFSGPLFAATLYVHVAALPYVICGGLAILTALLAWQFLYRDARRLVPAGIQPQ